MVLALAKEADIHRFDRDAQFRPKTAETFKLIVVGEQADGPLRPEALVLVGPRSFSSFYITATAVEELLPDVDAHWRYIWYQTGATRRRPWAHIARS